MSDAADRHIRLSESHYEQLRLRKREGESFDDVVGRLLTEDRDLLAGFGVAGGRDRVDLEAVHEATKDRSAERIERFGSERDQSASERDRS